MTLAYIFPGQGSQAVGMGRDVYDAVPSARAVFEEVDEALGEALSKTIFEGPDSALRLTANTQPALFATSLALWRALEAEGASLEAARFVAGHSLGEYSALAAAGALSITDGARLLRLRGDAMQRAVPEGVGAMAAVLGLDADAAQEVAAEAAGEEVCELANDNAPGQAVLSGHATAVARADEIATARGAKRVMPLPVSAPFHCALMAPAADAMAEALAETVLSRPAAPILANVSTELLDDPTAIRNSLVQQVTGRVRWRESIASAPQLGVTELIEVGSGKVLTGLTKRIDRSLKGTAINSIADVAAFAERLQEAA